MAITLNGTRRRAGCKERSRKKVTSEVTFKGYKRHASKDESQYIIKSDKTGHIAIHKASALKKLKNRKLVP